MFSSIFLFFKILSIMRVKNYLFLLAFLVMLGACSEQEEPTPLQNGISQAILDQLKAGEGDIIGLKGEKIPRSELTLKNTSGPFSVTGGSVSRVLTGVRAFVSGNGYAAGIYFCDIFESGATITLPNGAVVFMLNASTLGYATTSINTANVSNTPEGVRSAQTANLAKTFNI
ncbi:MAG: hypothetical protein HC880_02980 [Bacteroidia bacterium]|nr:hypothetical protein [Bacteroidia bacterium]